MASSMLMSMTCAPFSTCWRATASACSKSPARIMRAKALEPVTLVRSPMLTNSEPAPMATGSRPDRRIGHVVGPEHVGGQHLQARVGVLRDWDAEAQELELRVVAPPRRNGPSA
jgi:hypothetical protein